MSLLSPITRLATNGYQFLRHLQRVDKVTFFHVCVVIGQARFYTRVFCFFLEGMESMEQVLPLKGSVRLQQR